MPTDIKTKAIESRLTSIAEMATDYTGMIRVFKKGSKKIISRELYGYLKGLNTWDSESVYKMRHEEFCKWFVGNSNIQLTRTDSRPSWGHAAKVFDIATKVFVYFCNLPSHAQADQILRWLNAAIDTPILESLQDDFTEKYSTLRSVRLNTMKREEYERLQHLIKQKAAEDDILSVEWEELTWRRLNRK